MLIRDQKTGRIISAKRLFVFNPMRECLCGCGELVKMYDSKHGKDRLYKHGHNDPGGRFKKGLVPHNYKGKTIERGYVRIAGYYNHPRNHDGRVFEHILVMEKLLGRYIDETEVVHHKNGDRRDNKPENLEIMIRGQHQRYHNHLRYHK